MSGQGRRLRWRERPTGAGGAVARWPEAARPPAVSNAVSQGGGRLGRLGEHEKPRTGCPDARDTGRDICRGVAGEYEAVMDSLTASSLSGMGDDPAEHSSID
jgi:hypothetical protein